MDVSRRGDLSSAHTLPRFYILTTLLCELLGHSQLETTRIYARADIEMKRKALEKIEPLQQSGNNHELFDWEDKSLIMRLAGLT